MAKVKDVSVIIAKTIAIVICFYLFLISLGLMETSFRLALGKAANTFLTNQSFLGNPIIGLMVGILGTVLVQSSSTFTSILISMGASDRKFEYLRCECVKMDSKQL